MSNHNNNDIISADSVIANPLVTNIKPINWNKYAIIFGSSHPELQILISSYLNVNVTQIEIRNFNNSEIFTKIGENIRNKHIIIVQSPVKNSIKSVNDYIMELLLLCNACKLSSVKSITCIIPCLPYARSDKKDESRVCIGARMICDLLESQKVNRIVTVDLHAGQIQGFASIPFDNLYAMPLLCKVIKKLYLSNGHSSDYVLVSPDAGSNKRVNAYAKILRIPLMKFDKQRDHTQVSVVDSVSLITQINPLNKIAIIIDDIVDTMGTMINVIEELAKYGIKKAIIIATHGIFSGSALARINNCDLIENVIITNTLPMEDKMLGCRKIIKVNIHKMLGDVIKCLITGDTISDMFRGFDINEFDGSSIEYDQKKNEINFFY